MTCVRECTVRLHLVIARTLVVSVIRILAPRLLFEIIRCILYMMRSMNHNHWVLTALRQKVLFSITHRQPTIIGHNDMSCPAAGEICQSTSENMDIIPDALKSLLHEQPQYILDNRNRSDVELPWSRNGKNNGVAGTVMTWYQMKELHWSTVEQWVWCHPFLTQLTLTRNE